MFEIKGQMSNRLVKKWQMDRNWNKKGSGNDKLQYSQLVILLPLTTRWPHVVQTPEANHLCRGRHARFLPRQCCRPWRSPRDCLKLDYKPTLLRNLETGLGWGNGLLGFQCRKNVVGFGFGKRKYYPIKKPVTVKRAWNSVRK